jgi:hypothetical protein
MRARRATAFLTIIVALWRFPPEASAQQGLTAGADVMFYGDNTEFHNPFREGETLFGAAARLDAGVELSDTVTLALGVFANQRFGSDDAFELVRPILSITVKGRRSRFVFGTLVTPRVGDPAGPDNAGPHGLVPPVQRETLAFDRPYEAGLQWTFDGPRLGHDAWVQWQRLNTPRQRERLDAGARLLWRLHGPLFLPFQAHVVHEGGQLFSAGPVRDSFALASGLVISNRRGDVAGRPRARPAPAARDGVSASVELLGLWSRYTPDREAANPTRAGGAFFGRAAVEARGWRVHLIAWRGDDFVKDEGDPNYMSMRRDGTRYRGVRDYSEAGVTRTFDVAPGAFIETSFRFHRVERHYEYSYRVVAVARVQARLK